MNLVLTRVSTNITVRKINSANEGHAEQRRGNPLTSGNCLGY